MDRLTWMASFVRVVETGGITNAARRGTVSKAVVSKHLALLEEHLQVRLLNRTTRSLHLTEVGQTYYERCVRILSDIADADSIAAHLQLEPRGKLRISAPMSFGQLHLAPALGEFLAMYQDIVIDLVLSDRFVDVVEEGFDLAVRIGRLSDSILIARKLAPSRLVACASPEYLAHHPAPEHPLELEGHQCLLYSFLPNPHQWKFKGKGGDFTVSVQGRITVNNGDVVRSAALSGLGIAILPTFLVGADLRSGALLPILNEYQVPASNIHAVYPGNPSAKVRFFVEFLANKFGGERPYWDWSYGV